MRPDPARVWLVRAGERTGVRGMLFITDDAVTFSPDDGDPLHVTPRRITAVRREIGTPVITLSYLDDEEDEAHLLLYFAPPPPLPERGLKAPYRTFGLERTAGILGLGRSNRELKPLLKEWEKSIGDLRGAD
jgi:hypothetical protein